MPSAPPLLVLSHLRWRPEFQRQQQIMSRLARRRPVWFVEEPVFATGPAALDVIEVDGGIRVCQPRTDVTEAGFGRRQNEAIAPQVVELLRREALEPFVAWLSTPMATSLARRLAPKSVVYDCTDDLAGFHGARPELAAYEQILLEWADLVFTGGASLHRARREHHPSVHCFPSGVDVAGCTPRPGCPESEDHAPLARPRLGYFGVIDERIDLALLDALAGSHPDWSVILVGPVARIDAATVPRRPNLHYLGPRPHAELPICAAAWDLCLMPFALGRTPRFISPTRTLEYMAARRPIVTTTIVDVAEPFADIVHVGAGEAEFIGACERALAEPAARRAARQAGADEVLARSSWDATVAAIEALLDAAPARRAAPARSPAHRAAAAGRAPAGEAAGDAGPPRPIGRPGRT